MGSGDQPDIHANRLRASDALKFPLLQNAQQLGLRVQRQVADFIQKQRAAMRLLKTADTMLDRARECAFHVSEKLGFKQAFGKSVAVDGDHGEERPWPRQMDRARDHLFAGAGFAGDQYRRSTAADQADHLDGAEQCRARPDQQVAPRLV